MFLHVLGYGSSTTLPQILISPRFPIHPSKGVQWCSRKRLSEVSEASVHCMLKKITAPNISAYFAYFPEKRPGWSSFYIHSQAFVVFFQKALQSNYSLENLLAPASVKRNSTAHVISGIFQNLKNMQVKAAGCNLKTCNLLKGNT